MNYQKIFVPVAGVAAVAVAYMTYGWGGVAIVAGALVMFLLLHFTRMMQVLRRASSRPIGYCDSAVMLNAKLRPRVNLMHVLALTRALGEQLSPRDEQPEIFRWTDTTESHVTCEFMNGRLIKWKLERPAAPVETPDQPAP